MATAVRILNGESWIENSDDHSITNQISKKFKANIIENSQEHSLTSIYSSYSKLYIKMVERMGFFDRNKQQKTLTGRPVTLKEVYRHGKETIDTYERKWNQYRVERMKLEELLKEED